MNKVVESAKTIDEAIQAGLKKLGLTFDQVEINILAEPSKGFLGFGSKNAEVELIAKQTINQVANQVNNEVTSQATNQDAKEEGKRFLQNVFEAMELDITIEESTQDDHIVFNLVGDNLGVLIGRRGQTLDALQYLLNVSSNRNSNENVRFMLDAEQYRERRKKTLESLADRLANKAKKYKKDIVLEPMSPYERKIIHTHLQDVKGIVTKSQGQEPFRKIVISAKKGNWSDK